MMRDLIARIGDSLVCRRCGRLYRYHGLIVCDSCHAAGNRAEEAKLRKEREA